MIIRKLEITSKVAIHLHYVQDQNKPHRQRYHRTTSRTQIRKINKKL